ncbi:MAG: hypothetical protein WC283_01625 [Candidatus Paceibacterota bacterium]|jgi:hypothetical protein|nr:hypothetical protein [Candidatus Paceibacterota bacterium]
MLHKDSLTITMIVIVFVILSITVLKIFYAEIMIIVDIITFYILLYKIQILIIFFVAIVTALMLKKDLLALGIFVILAYMCMAIFLLNLLEETKMF